MDTVNFMKDTYAVTRFELKMIPKNAGLWCVTINVGPVGIEIEIRTMF